MNRKALLTSTLGKLLLFLAVIALLLFLIFVVFRGDLFQAGEKIVELV